MHADVNIMYINIHVNKSEAKGIFSYSKCDVAAWAYLTTIKHEYTNCLEKDIIQLTTD